MLATSRRAAILIGAPPAESPALPFADRIPGHLLSVADKPWLQHLVEALRDAGVTHVHCFDAIAPERSRALLEDGRRWGCVVSHHAVSDPACRIGALQLAELGDDACWIIEARDWAAPGSVDGPMPFRLVSSAGEPVGWARVDYLTRQRIPPSLAAHELADWFAREIPHAVTCPATRLSDGSALIDVQRAVLEGRHPAHIDAAQIEPGIWVARNVRLHPTVITHPPLLLAADSWLQADSCVGPNAVVGAGAIVGAQCVVAEACVGRATVLGEGLELRRAFASSSRLWNIDHATELEVRDDHILTTLQPDRSARPFASFLARATAVALLVAASPLLAGTAAVLRLRRGRVATLVRVARLPAQGYPQDRAEQILALWEPAPGSLTRLRHLSCWLLPGLWHVALGRLQWVGISPRGWDALDAAPSDASDVLRNARCGLIDEAWLRFGPAGVGESDVEARLWADVYQSVQREGGYAMRLLVDYLRCLLAGHHAAAVPNPDQSSKTTR